MNSALNRRWFRFSLRTTFVVVTLFGLWFGYYLNWKQQRHDARAWMHAQDIVGNFGYTPKDPSTFPWMLKLLGDSPEELFVIEYLPREREILLPVPDEYRTLVARIKRLFPEAVVIDGLPFEEDP